MLRAPRFLLFIATIFYAQVVLAQGVAINSTGAVADTNAMLDVSSGSKGVLISRMDSAHRMAIVSPSTGLLIFQTDGLTPGFYTYVNSAWQKVGATVQPHIMIYNTPGNYTFTTSSNITTATLFKITVVGGGGSGGGSAGGGGGGGAVSIYWGPGLTAGTDYAVNVGSGGVSSSSTGTTGGPSSITLGSFTVSSTGGGGGTPSNLGLGGTAANGTINIGGGPGSPPPGSSGGNGGSTQYGTGGAGGLISGSAGNGSGFGGGGGGSGTTHPLGGSGAGGVVIIEWSE